MATGHRHRRHLGRSEPSTILAGLAVFGDRIGNNALEVGVRLAAFVLILVGAALIPAAVRAGEAVEEPAVEAGSPTASPA